MLHPFFHIEHLEIPGIDILPEILQDRFYADRRISIDQIDQSDLFCGAVHPVQKRSSSILFFRQHKSLPCQIQKRLGFMVQAGRKDISAVDRQAYFTGFQTKCTGNIIEENVPPRQNLHQISQKTVVYSNISFAAFFGNSPFCELRIHEDLYGSGILLIQILRIVSQDQILPVLCSLSGPECIDEFPRILHHIPSGISDFKRQRIGVVFPVDQPVYSRLRRLREKKLLIHQRFAELSVGSDKFLMIPFEQKRIYRVLILFQLFSIFFFFLSQTEPADQIRRILHILYTGPYV